MKKSGLSWEDKCFTVDSFQGLPFCSLNFLYKLKTYLKGNEDDYIIISIVSIL